MSKNTIKRKNFYKTDVSLTEIYGELKRNEEGNKYVKDIDTRVSTLINKGVVIPPYEPNFVGEIPEIAIKDLQEAYNVKMANLTLTEQNIKRAKEELQFLKEQKERELLEKAKKELSNDTKE